MSQTRTTATAQIASAWGPEPYDQPAEGPALVRIHVEEAFTGDLEGDGVATMLQVLHGDGSASFCARERVAGTPARRTGTFVPQDTGELDADGHVAGSWFVVPGSGTGELAGLRGEGGFDAQLGQHAEARID
jgi:Protein of unknown function (DUF3224)